MNPLTESVIEQLDIFLSERLGEHGGMFNVEMVDGFACALAVASITLDEQTFVAEVLGEDFAFESAAEEAAIRPLLLALRNDAERRVLVDEEDLAENDFPLLALSPDFEDIDPQSTEEFAGLAWSMGFHHGLDLQSEVWDEMIDGIDGLEEDIDQIGELLMIGDSPDTSPAITLERRMEILAVIPGFLSALKQMQTDRAA